MSHCLQQSVINRRGQNEAALITSVAAVVWGISIREGSRQARFYLQYYNARTGILDLGIFFPDTHSDIVALVNIIKDGRDKTLAELGQDLLASAAKLPWFKATKEAAAKRVVEFGAALWLMLDTKGWQDHEILRDFVHRQFPASSSAAMSNADINDILFNARILHQVGGMEIIWTSNIREHLRMSGDAIFLFRHASYLNGNHMAPDRNVWPQRFLIETAQTIAILFPFSESSCKRWDRRIRKKNDLDIEAGISCNTPRNLEHYVYWHDRLRELQIAFDRSKPNRLRQWFHDKRDSNQYYTFWFAVCAIILTLLFGLARTITGIIQVINSG